MANRVLISESEWRGIVSNWSKQIDVNWIYQAFQLAQDKFIEPILGETFNQWLLGQYNGGTLSPEETTLVYNYIQPALAWRIAEIAVINHNAHVVNVGVTTVSGGFHAAAADQKSLNLVAIYGGDAHFYSDKLRRYLSDNEATFPLWTNRDKANSADSILGNDTGIHFRKRFRNRWC